MFAHLRMAWVAVRDSLWFIPALMTLAAGSLAIFLTRMERNGWITLGDMNHWLLGGGAEGARAVLSSIASGLITVTGTVFSVTIVALQLASSQFTPRVLRNFTADRSNQLVLGVFIGTFTYALLVLRVVRSSAEGEEAFVPRLAVGLSVILVVVSVGFLIYFINHAARSMQIAFILDRVTRRSIHQLKLLFPETIGHPAEPVCVPKEVTEHPKLEVRPDESGYLQAVDGDSLFRLGKQKQLFIRMERRVGEFVLADEAIASVWPADEIDDVTVQTIQRAFVFGPERTPEQDVEFGIIEIADIAVKALSPGINDPTTAIRCIDRLSEILSLLAVRRPPADIRTREGRVHFFAMHTEFERAVRLAFEQIAHYGSKNPMIVNKLLDTFSRLERIAPECRRHPLQVVAAEIRLEAKHLDGGPTADRSW